MSTLGAPGWSAIGRKYGTWYFWVLVLGAVLGVVGLLWLILWGLKIAQPVQTVLEWIFWILAVVWLILFFGLMAAVGWRFVIDLGHNFYAKWKTTGIGSAFKGLWADVKTCGGALFRGFGQKAKENVGPLIGRIKKFFGF